MSPSHGFRRIPCLEKSLVTHKFRRRAERRGRRAKTLSISGSSQEKAGSLDVRITPGRALVFNTLGDDYEGLALTIRDGLKARSFALRKLQSPYFWWAASALALVGTLSLLAILGISGYSGLVRSLYYPLAAFVAVVHFLWFLFALRRRRRVAAILVRRHEDKSFVERNWEKILLLLVGAVVGLVAKWITEWYF